MQLRLRSMFYSILILAFAASAVHADEVAANRGHSPIHPHRLISRVLQGRNKKLCAPSAPAATSPLSFVETPGAAVSTRYNSPTPSVS